MLQALLLAVATAAEPGSYAPTYSAVLQQTVGYVDAAWRVEYALPSRTLIVVDAQTRVFATRGIGACDVIAEDLVALPYRDVSSGSGVEGTPAIPQGGGFDLPRYTLNASHFATGSTAPDRTFSGSSTDDIAAGRKLHDDLLGCRRAMTAG